MDNMSIPHPCDGELYKKWTAWHYFGKVTEELQEAAEAFVTYWFDKSDYNYDHLLLECTDVIVAMTGFMDKLGCDACSRANYIHRINWSNAQRDEGKRFKDNPWYLTEEERHTIEEEIDEDKD